MALTDEDMGALSSILRLDAYDVSAADMKGLAEAMAAVEYSDGQTIIQQGDLDDAITIVLKGDVVIRSDYSAAGEELGRSGAGEILGLLGLVDNAPRAASCTSAGAVRVAVLDGEAFRKASAASPRLSLAFHRALGAQLARDYRNVVGVLEAEMPKSTAVADWSEGRGAAAAEAAGVDCDVAVIGGGPVGLMYALWLRKLRPDTHVVVLERREFPGYKPEESLLPTTVRALLDLGLTLPQLRRLFSMQTGRRFWWVGHDSTKPENEVDLLDLDETFLVERRVLELSLQRLCHDAGVDLRVGTSVDAETSDIGEGVQKLRCAGPQRDYVLTASLVCDATGPAAVLPRQFEAYRKDPSRIGTFQTNVYFAYFRPKSTVALARWDDPAARYLCTGQGWIWFRDVHSWEGADDRALSALVDDVLSQGTDVDQKLPPRSKFCERHGTDFSVLTSVGIVVRQDMDTAMDLPIQQRFDHYVERYPALGWLLEHYELVEEPYREKRRPYTAFMQLSHDCSQVADGGWLAVGDSAQSPNPLFDQGINLGCGGAYQAAVCTAEALTAGDTGRSAFKAYDDYAASVYESSSREADVLYRSWSHPDGFEATLMAKLHLDAVNAQSRKAAPDAQPWVAQPASAEWSAVLDGASEAETNFERDGGEASALATALASVTDPFVAARRAQVGAQDLDRVFTNHDATGARTDGQSRPRGELEVYRCPSCTQWQSDALSRCAVCGTAKPGAAEAQDASKSSDVTAVRIDRQRYRLLRVSAIREETALARTVEFEVPEEEQDAFKYSPGQFLTLRVEINGEPEVRCYSLSSSPTVDERPAITVKRVKGGLVSNWLCETVKVGDVVEVRPPEGRFTVPDRQGALFLFAAGSGITPVWSIAQEALANTERQVRLVYVNNSPEDTIMQSAIHAARDKYGQRFRLIERVGKREGRIDTRDVQAYCEGQTKGLFFVCGPWGFMDVVEEGLLDLGADLDSVHVERFASPKKPPKEPVAEAAATEESAEATAEPAEEAADAPAMDGPAVITMDMFGDETEITCEPGQTLAQAAEEAGVDVPLSCEEGYCGTCMCLVTEGKTVSEVDDALSKGQKQRGMVLACQARPVSATATVVFE
jgi:3-ketosteroid 9alpha-monooxygenase subunit B